MKERLTEILEGMPSRRIIVLGDYLLDEYVSGEISRISREAPVLILSYQDRALSPGGGANAVEGIAALEVETVALGAVGADEAASTMIGRWSARVDGSLLVRIPGQETTRKSRILAGLSHSSQQQLVRIDYEHGLALDAEQEEAVETVLREQIPAAHAVVLSDYSLGGVTAGLADTAIHMATQLGKPVVVDSRFEASRFRGATCITPNISEVEAHLSRRVGDRSDLEAVGHRLIEDWQLECLLITQGKHGMSLFDSERVSHIPCFGSDEVVDVTGAGDTVISVFTSVLAAGGTSLEAAHLANVAAGIVVTKKGTASVSRSELLEALNSDEPLPWEEEPPH